MLTWGCVPPLEQQFLQDDPAFSNTTISSNDFGGGNGSQSDPFLITNANQLKKLVDDVNKGNDYANTFFKLTTDIQVTADEWIPIGYIDPLYYDDYDEKFVLSFKGDFNGDDHTISGTLKSNKFIFFGFFGYIEDSRISNLTIEANIINEGNDDSLPTLPYLYWEGTITYTGAIVGEGTGTIVNCNVSGKVMGGNTSDGSNTGGIVGSFSGALQNCIVDGSVIGGTSDSESITGGIVGELWDSSIQNCNVTGPVNGAIAWFSNTGGIVGNSIRSTIHNCNVSNYITGEKGMYSVTGGIVGETRFCDVTNCTVFNSAKVTGGDGGDRSWTGGIHGEDTSGTRIIDCTNNATVSSGFKVTNGTEYVGGIAGGGSIQNCTNNGNVYGNIDVWGSSYVGGLVGSGAAETSLNTGNIFGDPNFYIGGLAGGDSWIFSCCTNRGMVNGQPATDNNQIGQGNVEPCTSGHPKR